MIVQGQGGGYKVFRLKNANAVEVARVLNEWFNGPQQQPGQQRTGTRSVTPAGRRVRRPGRAIRQPVGNRSAVPDRRDPTKPRVRIVAEQSSNSLLVRANALDLITIQNLLDSVLDVGPGTRRRS